MNKTLAKQLFITAIAVTGINFLSSCESCNRKDTDTTVTPGGNTGNDMYNNDTLIEAEGTGNNSGGGNYSGSGSYNNSQNNASGSGTGNTTGGSSTGNTASGSSGSNTSSTNKGNTSNYNPKNDPVENSNYHRNKEAGSVESGGSAGTGQGTGTGTTGNNSRVSDPRDQN